MIQFAVENIIYNACAKFKGVALMATFCNSLYSEKLWEEINASTNKYKALYNTEDIKALPSIQATRDAYRALGKDPSRYRPSGEALIRRILKDKPLFHINTAVDLINLASIEYGYSIGGFDLEKIQGETISLGVGRANEPYEGIGRGVLNIENMPVYRDSVGGFGTPTSDNERTKLELTTTKLLAIVNAYDGNLENAQNCANRMAHLLTEYAQGKNYKILNF
mgnify:CR=1 FL=1